MRYDTDARQDGDTDVINPPMDRERSVDDPEVSRDPALDQNSDPDRDPALHQHPDADQDPALHQNPDLDRDTDLDRDPDLGRDKDLDQDADLDQDPERDLDRDPVPVQAGGAADEPITDPDSRLSEPVAGVAPVDSAEPPETIFPQESVHEFHERWREVQLRFVDDPSAAADEAEALVSQVLDQFSATIATHKSELDAWRSVSGTDQDADTERMRMAVRRYRSLLDRLLEV